MFKYYKLKGRVKEQLYHLEHKIRCLTLCFLFASLGSAFYESNNAAPHCRDGLEGFFIILRIYSDYQAKDNSTFGLYSADAVFSVM
jgi:hypothetical protein